eukprot:XP_001705552.1 Hypothetical protein GL50803_24701 [Giardia lamblia ATCC 50803]
MNAYYDSKTEAQGEHTLDNGTDGALHEEAKRHPRNGAGTRGRGVGSSSWSTSTRATWRPDRRDRRKT